MAATTAGAQTPDNDTSVTKPADPCQAQPDDKTESYEDKTGRKDNPMGVDRRPELKDCNGVVTPPKTGDQRRRTPEPHQSSLRRPYPEQPPE